MLAQSAPTLSQASGANMAAIIALVALALTCGCLSLVVVWRRWAFMGEGIAHAGFGGAGTAWMLAAMFPALDNNGMVSLCIVLFCLATALAIAAVHRSGEVQSDTAIGAFLAGALAWGFLGQQLYLMAYHRVPAGFTALLFGETRRLESAHAQLAFALLIIAAALLISLRRHILLFCLDPDLARTSGIRASAIHYTLALLVALTIIVGVRLIGSVLITAMLILPGATAMLLTRRLYTSIWLSSATACAAVVSGLYIASRWPALPQGPLIVLSLFALFIASWGLKRLHPA